MIKLSRSAAAAAASALSQAIRLALSTFELGQRVDAVNLLRSATAWALDVAETSSGWNWKATYDVFEAAAALLLHRCRTSARSASFPMVAILSLRTKFLFLSTRTRCDEATGFVALTNANVRRGFACPRKHGAVPFFCGMACSRQNANSTFFVLDVQPSRGQTIWRPCSDVVPILIDRRTADRPVRLPIFAVGGVAVVSRHLQSTGACPAACCFLEASKVAFEDIDHAASYVACVADAVDDVLANPLERHLVEQTCQRGTT